MKKLTCRGRVRVVETKSFQGAGAQFESAFAPLTELKFVSESGEAAGEFSGYGAFFHTMDSHADVILPGAFKKTLAEHSAKGTMPGLYVEHGQYSPFGPPALPVGVWTEMQEDDKGLRVKGRLSGLNTDEGKKLRSLMQDGAIRGLSIAYAVPPGGATVNRKAGEGEPKRVLKEVDLDSVDLVRSPSNRFATVDAIKSVLAIGDHEAAAQAIGAAILLHKSTMGGGDTQNGEERAAMLQHLRTAHRALTGLEEPSSSKSFPRTIREFETMLREDFGLSNQQARLLAEGGFKALPRDEVGEKATKASNTALDEIGASLRGFSLPTFS